MIITSTDSTIISIQTKNAIETTLVWSLYPPKEKGGRMKSADIMLYSSQEMTQTSSQNSPLIIDHPGEYEMRGVFIVGFDVQGSGAAPMIFAVDLEEMRFLLIPGTVSNILTQEQLSSVGSIDGAIIASEPTSSPSLADIVNQIEPRVVIVTESASSQGIIKKIGLPSERVSKCRLSKKELPQEHTACFVLANE